MSLETTISQADVPGIIFLVVADHTMFPEVFDDPRDTISARLSTTTSGPGFVNAFQSQAVGRSHFSSERTIRRLRTVEEGAIFDETANRTVENLAVCVGHSVVKGPAVTGSRPTPPTSKRLASTPKRK